MSKYSFTEFSEGIKYYTGKGSPISVCRKIEGYSPAWLHHKGRNKHHYQYWVDEGNPVLIPYKYVAEMICDTVAAGINYNGKSWTKEHQLNYWNSKKDEAFIHPKVKQILNQVYGDLAIYGIDKVITKENIKKTYCDIVNEV
ncbi:hypothetical protein D3C76_1436580 [compost metagenome]